MLPNFLIIGAAKCGTTSLHRQLRAHPDVFMPGARWKEPTFFSEHGQGRWQRGLDWYKSLFAGWRGEHAVGEASTSYTKAPVYADAPDKIARTLPGAKLIFLVRDPVAQIVSHYRHLVFFDGWRWPFERAVREDRFLLDTARYATQLAPYLERFPEERLCVVPFERYVAAPVREAKRICRFLGVNDRIDLQLGRARNASRGRRLIRGVHSPRAYRAAQRLLPSPARRLFDRVLTRPLPRPSPDQPIMDEIRRTLEPEARELERMTGLDLHHWRSGG